MPIKKTISPANGVLRLKPRMAACWEGSFFELRKTLQWKSGSSSNGGCKKRKAGIASKIGIPFFFFVKGREDDTKEKTGQGGNERHLQRPGEVLEIAAQSCA